MDRAEALLNVAQQLEIIGRRFEAVAAKLPLHRRKHFKVIEGGKSGSKRSDDLEASVFGAP